ncbi:uncharacterized protein (TIGR00251 family) [Pseudorhizobium tarimense]|uniref:UPF0235 protein ABID21_003305 n=1 Tax=Pseudorhizobium tarimense TaxID=1079109 RepID=A0ABV2H9G7_9HYPH|nr:DUF167 family protein [Pseudorhizobium tarimense]MCJ8520186.1 DUF167 family protein [Pseudorhizobium tarimense]
MSPGYSRQADHFRLSVRLTPSAGREAVDGIETADNGESYLRARVTAVPEDGKANKALIALLAKHLRMPKSAIIIMSGETARKKILRLDGEPEDVCAKLEALARR